jgi:hypothetical protein
MEGKLMARMSDLTNYYVWKKVSGIPTIDDVPPTGNTVWVNTDSGEIFVYRGIINNKAVWYGQMGTTIGVTVKVFDIFNDNSAVALYRFEYSANDDGGLHNGVWSGTEAYDNGKFSKVASLNGSSYISIGDSNFLNIGTNPYSFSFWVNFSSINSNENAFLGKYDSDAGSLTLEYLDDSKKFVGYADSNTQIVFSDALSNGLVTGTWYHIVFVVEQDNYRCYLNGEKLPVTLNGNNFNVSKSITPIIGNYSSSGSGDINGLIDQFRIFNRALSDNEVNILYNEY